MAAIRLLMFEAAVATIFGDPFLKRHGWETLEASFHTFESMFELAASPMPHIFMPGFRKCRAHLLAAFR